MKKGDLQELHNICAIENLASILKHGILSNKRITKKVHRSIAMEEIQERRRNVVIPGARPMHEYANLYINGRNKMMYKIICNNDVSDICVLRISKEVLDIPDVVIADMNASSDHVRFRASPQGLRYIDKDLVFSKYWTHPDDPFEEMRHGSIICAEILVPDHVGPKYIMCVYVANEEGQQKVLAVAADLPVDINSNMFFR